MNAPTFESGSGSGLWMKNGPLAKFAGAALLWSMLGASPAHAASCPPGGYDAGALQALKARGFALAATAERDRLAVALLDCLGDPDPGVRDGVAYEALATWMRADQLAPDTLHTLYARLRPMLADEDPDGFRRPFAALVLAEVARTDWIGSWLEPGERALLVAAAADYLRGVREYRGFVDGEGWRHGVAHGADLVRQLAVNPALDRKQLDALRDAVAAQVAPAGAHAYVHGEPVRLARAVLPIAQRGLHDAADWQAWFAGIAVPAPWPDWNAALASEAGLARRHDTVAFLTALYVLVHEESDAASRDRLLPGLRAAIKQVP